MAADPDHIGLERSVSGVVRIAVLGMPCGFTRAALSTLLEPGEDGKRLRLERVIVAGSGADRPPGFDVVPNEAARVPIERIGSQATLSDPVWLDHVRSLRLDLIVTACFPWRLPEAVLGIPVHGCINIHPSLLPDGRGPEPVFWAFRWGLDETGVTVHQMDRGLDTGAVFAQATVPIGDDATIPSLESELAAAGGALARGVIADIVHGTVAPRPQPRSTAPIARFPGPDDLSVSTDQSAASAARFIRAVSPVFGPISCLVVATGQRTEIGGSRMIEVRDDDPQVEPVAHSDGVISIRFAPGVIRFRCSSGASPLTLHPPVPASRA